MGAEDDSVSVHKLGGSGGMLRGNLIPLLARNQHDIFCTFSHVFVSFCRVSSPGMGTAVKKIKGPAAYLRTTFPRSGEPKAPQPLPLRGSRGEGGG